MESSTNRGVTVVMSPAPSNSVGSIIRNETESSRSPRATAHLIRIPEAAEITGLPASLLRKSFMRDDKRPKNIPPPPPHKRIGRAVYILADELVTWIEGIGGPVKSGQKAKRRRGRPSVAERIMLRTRDVA